MTALSVALAVLATPALLASAYLLLLAAASRRGPVPSAGSGSVRFDVIIPAHDEEIGIACTVRSVLATGYPAALRRVIVVADNCSEGTGCAWRRLRYGLTRTVRSPWWRTSSTALRWGSPASVCITRRKRSSPA